MRLNRDEASAYAGRTVGTYSMAGGFGVVVMDANEDRVVWAWSDSPGRIRASAVRAGRSGPAFRAGRVWVRLGEVERTFG